MQPNGRLFKKVILGEYKWLTFGQVLDKAKRFGSGLLAIGQQQRQNVIIFAETKADWIIAAQACFAYNFPGNKLMTIWLLSCFYTCDFHQFW